MLQLLRAAFRVAQKSYPASRCDQQQAPLSCRVDACKLQIALRDILKAQCRATSCSKLTIQEIFGYTTVLHSTHVSEPAQSTFAKHEMHAAEACFLQHSGVGDFVCPSRPFSCRAYIVQDSLPYSRVLRKHA